MVINRVSGLHAFVDSNKGLGFNCTDMKMCYSEFLNYFFIFL